MKKLFTLLLTMVALSVMAEDKSVTSPDGRLKVTITCEEGIPSYSVTYDDRQMLAPSALGLRTSIGDYTSGMTITGSEQRDINRHYTMTKVKASDIHYQACALTLHMRNGQGQGLDVEFQVSDNDIAYRYQLLRPEKNNPKCVNILSETTAFNFPDGTTTFLCPQINPMTGWERTKPSYEEEYTPDAEMAVASKYGHGYTFPCLFKIGETGWVLVGETGVSSQYCGSHLSDYETGRGYTIAFPDEGENNGIGSAFASILLPGYTPWRTITVGQTLAPIVETTVQYDVVEPLYQSAEWNNRPGRYTWSWLIWQDKSINYDDQVRFIDTAAAMGYEYVLVDNWWDRNIGRDRIKTLSEYARSKGVSLMLWYNSNGYQNDAPQTPRDCMNTAIAREREMRWLQSIGVKGIKVDFFGGDKQMTMQLYEDILSDANRYGLQVIFHGCTVPRGWERMYPNFVASEAVLASENVFFSDYHAKAEPFQLTMHPFCRNATATMDWGGVIMNNYLSKDNKSRHPRATTRVFEMATGITNQTAVQCIAIQPNNLEELSEVELDFLRNIPVTWDETRYVAGYPGQYVVLARRHANDWYVAGLNAEQAPKRVSLYLPMLAGQEVSLYVDEKDETVLRQVKVNKKGRLDVTIQPNGGVIITTAPKATAIRVACVGNSITAGMGIRQPETNGYPARLQQLLGRDYRVRNFGVSSRTMLAKGDYPYVNEPEYIWCKTFDPNIVIVKLGTNDSKPYNWQHAADFEPNLQQMVDELRALPSQPRIYLATPIPAFKKTWGINDDVIAGEITPIIYKVAKRNGLEVIDLHTLYNHDGDKMQPDGIHPNADGARRLAELIAPVIKR